MRGEGSKKKTRRRAVPSRHARAFCSFSRAPPRHHAASRRRARGAAGVSCCRVRPAAWAAGRRGRGGRARAKKAAPLFPTVGWRRGPRARPRNGVSDACARRWTRRRGRCGGKRRWSRGTKSRNAAPKKKEKASASQSAPRFFLRPATVLHALTRARAGRVVEGEAAQRKQHKRRAVCACSHANTHTHVGLDPAEGSHGG